MPPKAPPPPAPGSATSSGSGSKLPVNPGAAILAASALQQQQQQQQAGPSAGNRIASTSPASAIPAPAAMLPRRQDSIADAVAMAVGTKRDRKRKRVHYSCAECHRRKHKCDRNTPCQACIDRGLGDSCRPFEEGDQHGDVRDRVMRLEDLVEGLARAHAGIAKELAVLKGTAPPDMALAITNGDAKMDEAEASTSAVAMQESDDETRGEGTSEAGRRRVRRADSRGLERQELRKSRVGREDRSTALYQGTGDDEGAAPGVNPLEGGLTREGDSFYGALALPSVSRGVIETRIHGERLELSANVPLRSASAKVRRLIQEGGAHPDVVNELMQNLPSRAESDEMLEWYFRDINLTRLPLHEHTFRQSYEELMDWRWGTAREEEGDDGARHLPFLSFLYVILAIAKRNEPEERSTDAEAKAGALKLFHTARRTMAVASAVRADHIDVLLAALFGCRFLICLRMSAESWSLLGSAIRAAQAIGLHRDGTKLGLDAVTTERRRRLWALIYYLDKTTSMLLGRPQGINDQNCDTLAPSDIDIDTLPRYGPAPLPEVFPPPPGVDRPKKPPGVYAFVAIRHELAKLTGRVVEHFQNLSKPRNYLDVLAIDADLQRFIDALPPQYRSEQTPGADHGFDDVCPWLPLHRYLINVEQLYIRTTLHRPYLLRSDKYSQSRTAAFASARADRQVRKEYKRDVKWPANRARNAHMGGLYRLFNAALVAGIQLLLEPQSPEAPELHAALDEFLALKSNEPADTSQCTKREVAIIQLFQAKSRDPSWCAATATGARRGRGAGAQALVPATAAPAAIPLDPRLPGLVGGPDWSLGRLNTVAEANVQAFAPLNVDLTPSGTQSNTALAQDLFDQLGAGTLDAFGLDHSPFSWDDGASARGGLNIPNAADPMGDFWAAAAQGSSASIGGVNAPLGANSPQDPGMQAMLYGQPSIDTPGSAEAKVGLTPWGGLIEAIASSSQAPHSSATMAHNNGAGPSPK